MAEANLEERAKDTPETGWVDTGDGWLTASGPFEHGRNFISEDFQKYAQLQRTRWSLGEYIAESIRQADGVVGYIRDSVEKIKQYLTQDKQE